MRFYQHQFEQVEDYLHQRPPYLLVDQIVSMKEKELETRKTVTGDEFFMKGHFPGAGIFPGAMMQELTTQSAGILIAAKYNPMQAFRTDDPLFNEYALGVLVKVKQARYKHFARPGDVLAAVVRLNDIAGPMFDFSASISNDNSVIMRIDFQLMNMKSDVLRGG